MRSAACQRGNVEEDPAAFVGRLVDGVPTRHEDGDVGIGGLHLVPLEPPGPFAARGQHRVAARGLDHVGHPVAAAEGRVRPLQRERARSMVLMDGAAHDVGTGTQLVHDRLRSRRGAGGIAHHLEAIDDLVERRRVERDHLGATTEHVERLLDRARRHRTHPAQVLGDDEIGLDVADALGVEGVDASPSATRALTASSISFAAEWRRRCAARCRTRPPSTCASGG